MQCHWNIHSRRELTLVQLPPCSHVYSDIVLRNSGSTDGGAIFYIRYILKRFQLELGAQICNLRFNNKVPLLNWLFPGCMVVKRESFAIEDTVLTKLLKCRMHSLYKKLFHEALKSLWTPWKSECIITFCKINLHIILKLCFRLWRKS